MIDTAVPASRNPTPRADIGVLLVHGIGDHKEGETLIGFGEPLVDWLRDWLRGKGGTDAHGSVKVTEARLRATRTEAVSPAYAQVEIALSDSPQTERWLFTEAWWGDTVQAPPSLRLMAWLLSRGPLLLYWHFYLGPLKEIDRIRQRDLALSFVALLIALLMQLAVVVAMVLLLVPFGPWRQAVVSGVRVLTLTLGDSFVLLEQDFQSAALTRRVERSFDWLAQRARDLIVIAHSQGGAIAYEALNRMQTSQVVAFISVGSGLEKLRFLRLVRDHRHGLVPAALVAPLFASVLGLGAAVALGGEADRWIAVLAVLLGIGALLAAVFLVLALIDYRKEMQLDASRLSLAGSLGERAEWHDLYATHDLVPNGRGSLLAGAAFVRRHELSNQRSYINDHVSYFGNRLGCLPVLWGLLAQHSRLALSAAVESARLQRLVRLHGWSAWLLWGSGAASWIALSLMCFVLRGDMPGFGASVQAAFDKVGGAALFKPVAAIGSLLAWLFGPGDAKAQAELAQANADSILGVLTVIALMLLWWLLFRWAWLLRSLGLWYRACRHPESLDAKSLGGREWAGLALWVAFGLVPLLVFGVIAKAPNSVTLQLVGNATRAVMALLVVALAWFYGAGSPWFMREVATTAAHAGKGDALVMAAIVPLGSQIVVVVFLQVARWFWPAAWGPAWAEGATTLTWTVIAISWLIWLPGFGGRTLGWGAVAAALATVVITLVAMLAVRSSLQAWLLALAPGEKAAALAVLGAACATIASLLRSRRAAWSALRSSPWGRRLFGAP